MAWQINDAVIIRKYWQINLLLLLLNGKIKVTLSINKRHQSNKPMNFALVIIMYFKFSSEIAENITFGRFSI